jgi:phosphinothricin acetyltransferase
MKIRKVKLNDAENIAEIYNFYIQQTHHTFETRPLSVEVMRDRISEIIKDYPYLVAEIDGRVFGYAYAAQFKLREAYQHSAEVSIYVKNDAKKRGIGSMIYQELFDELEDSDIHALIAGIPMPNDASVRFHEKLGFEKVAHFKEVGYKLGRWIDVGYWEKFNF